MATATTGTAGSRAAKKPNPRDYTGKVKAEAEAALADQVEERAAEMAMLTEVRAAEKTQVVDYTKAGSAVPGTVPGTKAPVVVEEVAEVKPEFRTIYVNTKIEDMVFGREVVREAFINDEGHHVPPVLGNMKWYNFEEGTPYKVPTALAEHLEEIGYLR